MMTVKVFIKSSGFVENEGKTFLCLFLTSCNSGDELFNQSYSAIYE